MSTYTIGEVAGRSGFTASALRHYEGGELTALADQLRHAAAQLSGPPVDGACNEGCACMALDNAVVPVGRSVRGTRR